MSIRKELGPGLKTLTWTSMTIEKFLSDAYSGIDRLSNLINHIHNNLKIIFKTLVCHHSIIDFLKMSQNVSNDF